MPEEFNYEDFYNQFHPSQGQAQAPVAAGVGVPPTATPSPETAQRLSYEQLSQLAQSKGFATGGPAETMAAISMAESNGDPSAWNKKDPKGGSYGITQINGVHPGAAEALNNNDRAMELAYQVSKGGKDFSPWTTYKDKSYQQHMPASGYAHPKEQDQIINPNQPKPKQIIGPFKDSYSAWQAAPQDIQNYELEGSDKTGYSWTPAVHGKDAFMRSDGGASMTQDQREDMQNSLRNYSIKKYGSGMDLVGHYLYNLGGPGINKGIADLIGAPGDIAQLGMNALGGTFGFKAPDFPLIKSRQMERLAGKIGIDTSPDESDVPAYLTSKIGQFVPSFLPGEGVVAGLARGATPSAASRAVLEFKQNPMAHFLGQAFDSAAWGLGTGTAGEIDQALFGKNNALLPTVELVGGGVLASRIPPLNVIGKGIAATARGAKSLFTGGAGGPAPYQGMTLDEARSAVGGLFHDRLTAAADEAQLNMAALGRTGTGPITDSERAEMQRQLVERGLSLKSEITGAFQDISASERQMWSKVDRSGIRDFSRTKQIEAEIRADADGLYRLNPESYPRDLGDLIQGKGGNKGKDGLLDFDQVGAGVDLLEKINAEIYNGMRSSGPANADRMQALEKLQSALVADLGRPEAMSDKAKYFPSGALKSYPLGQVDPNLTPALAFSQEAAALRAGPLRGAAYGGDGWTDGANTIEKYIRQGARGYDALSQLSRLAQARYGTADGPSAMTSLIKDTMRQKYIEQVAPNGYVSQAAHNQFMLKYGPLMVHPDMQNVRMAFENAAKSEGEVTKTLGFGLPQRQAGSFVDRENKMNLYLDSPSDVALRFAQTGGQTQNPFKATQNIIEKLKTDPSGQAFMGFKQQVAQKFLDETENGTAKSAKVWISKNSGMIDAINAEDPGFRNRIMDAANPTSKAGVANWIMEKGARLGGAMMGRKFAREVGSGATIQIPAIFSDAAHEIFKNMSALDRYKLSASVIADGEHYASFMKAGAGRSPLPPSLLPTILGAQTPGLYQSSETPEQQQQALQAPQ